VIIGSAVTNDSGCLVPLRRPLYEVAVQRSLHARNVTVEPAVEVIVNRRDDECCVVVHDVLPPRLAPSGDRLERYPPYAEHVPRKPLVGTTGLRQIRTFETRP
jgi:hypothetical protein